LGIENNPGEVANLYAQCISKKCFEAPKKMGIEASLSQERQVVVQRAHQDMRKAVDSPNCEQEEVKMVRSPSIIIL
jgi:hypothetical protein